MRFAGYPNLMFLVFPWLMNGKFAEFEQFKIESHFAKFGQVQSDPNCLSLLTLGRSVTLLTLGKTLGREKQLATEYGLSHFQ